MQALFQIIEGILLSTLNDCNMHLPDGYVSETHWSWSRGTPSVWSQETASCAWEHLDDTYLFPMSPPKSSLHSWSRRGSVIRSLSQQRPCADSPHRPDGDRANNVSSGRETIAGSSNSAPIPIRISNDFRPRRHQRSPLQSAKWRSIDGPDADPDMSWEARQRYERRFALTETRLESACQSSKDEKDCHCTECKSRRWRKAR